MHPGILNIRSDSGHTGKRITSEAAESCWMAEKAIERLALASAVWRCLSGRWPVVRSHVLCRQVVMRDGCHEEHQRH